MSGPLDGTPEPMHRPRRLRTLLVGLAATLLTLAGAPAGAQSQTEIRELEEQRVELGNELSTVDVELAASEVELDGVDGALESAEVRIELLADEFESAVDARRVPAATRIEIAIAGVTNGDPRQNAVLDEIRVLSGRDGADPTRARELYSAVIDDAQTRLDEADERLRHLTEELARARTDLETLRAARADADSRRLELGRRRAELILQLEETTIQIERLRAMQGKALLTGLVIFDQPIRPALIVKIDNVVAARPQAGIAQADIVYVEEVEGGLTRLAAVFHSQTPNQVGPVRSMRTGDFDLLSQFNSPLFSNSGGNRIAVRLLRESTLVDIGAGSNSDLYYRTSRPAPHNLFTNPANLWAVGQGDEYETGLPFPIFQFRGAGDPFHPDANPAAGVDIDYGQTVVAYSWNGSGWDRSQDGDPTVDADGTRIAPTTVILQITHYDASVADGASPHAITTGRGEAWILSDGQVLLAAWRREAETDQIEYVDATTGNIIGILPGQTWIEMPRTGDAVFR